MKASVVLPVYNKAPYLQECLDSILAQSFSAFELIAVDDASTDDSLSILRSGTDPRMKVIALERNVGPGGAAQRAIDAASGEYILRADADDIMLPERFAKQIALLDREPGIGACSGHIQLMTDPPVLHKVELEDVDCKAGMLFGVPLNQPASAYRRSVLVDNDIRFKDDWPHYGEDWMYQVHLARVTRFKNLDEPLILYRKGAMNIAHGRDRGADLDVLYRYIFDQLGFPISEDELEVQPYTVRFFKEAPTPERIRRFRAWLLRLSELNAERKAFDQAAFQKRLDRMWNDLFHHLPEYGWTPTMAYFKAGGGVTFPRLYYMAATLMGGTQDPERARR